MKRLALDFSSSKKVSLICGRGLAPLPDLSPQLFAGADKFCLVTDRRCLRTFKRAFNRMLGGASGRTTVFEAPDGGAAKNFMTLERLLSFMFENGLSRRSLLIAAGGGSVTDLAGLAAALYMRGINWLSVPTTLLGQADAGIGGKTAVDLAGVKNIAGAFYQPSLTVCDSLFLDTLGARELRSGAGELIKYALIAPSKLGRAVLNGLPAALEGGKKELAEVVSACAAFKLQLVSRDEREETGLRETLNFGHTAGHAFEAASKGSLSHGEAVLWGMRYAAGLSRKLGLMDGKRAGAVEAALRLAEPPALKKAALDFDRFSGLVRRDKKNGAQSNRFILIIRPGLLKTVENIPGAALKRCLEELENFRGGKFL
ncbi:MAG: 3-dehydroquinate synthase family protein [Elusimicrobiales bacterium]|jgi:3-dehydroquinate synthase